MSMRLLWHHDAPPPTHPLPEKRVLKTFIAHCPHCFTFKAVAMTEGRVTRALSNHIICAHFPTKRSNHAA